MSILFNRLEINPETGCIEAYLEGESCARTDIPSNPKTVTSLLELLSAYLTSQNEELLGLEEITSTLEEFR